jgi:hypothetical protein
MYWHDYAGIKLNYLFESLKKIGLVKRFDAQLRLWINTGTFNVTVTGANASNTGYNSTPADNTFSNTCPIMVNHHGGANGIVPATRTKIVAGLYIAVQRIVAGLYCTNSYYIICWYQFSR